MSETEEYYTLTILEIASKKKRHTGLTCFFSSIQGYTVNIKIYFLQNSTLAPKSSTALQLGSITSSLVLNNICSYGTEVRVLMDALVSELLHVEQKYKMSEQ